MSKLIDLVDLVGVLEARGRVSVFIWTLHWALLPRLAVSLYLKLPNILFYDIFLLILLNTEVKSDTRWPSERPIQSFLKDLWESQVRDSVCSVVPVHHVFLLSQPFLLLNEWFIASSCSEYTSWFFPDSAWRVLAFLPVPFSAFRFNFQSTLVVWCMSSESHILQCSLVFQNVKFA